MEIGKLEVKIDIPTILSRSVEEYAFIIYCPNKELLEQLRGLISDGGIEYDIAAALNVDIEDIRNEKGHYIGMYIKGISNDTIME